MSSLPPPSDTSRVLMNTGTLSGLDVLDLGRIEPGALIELRDGSTATVVSVQGKRLVPGGATPGSVQLRLENEQLKQVSSADIATVLRPPSAPEPEHAQSAAHQPDDVPTPAVGPAVGRGI